MLIFVGKLLLVVGTCREFLGTWAFKRLSKGLPFSGPWPPPLKSRSHFPMFSKEEFNLSSVDLSDWIYSVFSDREGCYRFDFSLTTTRKKEADGLEVPVLDSFFSEKGHSLTALGTTFIFSLEIR